MNPFLYEPYNAWQKPIKKKHWHETIEEEQLMARVIVEQQNSTLQNISNDSSNTGAGGSPPPEYFNQPTASIWIPLRIELTGAGTSEVNTIYTQTSSGSLVYISSGEYRIDNERVINFANPEISLYTALSWPDPTLWEISSGIPPEPTGTFVP